MEQKFLDKQKANLLSLREELNENLQTMQENIRATFDIDEQDDREDIAVMNITREQESAGRNLLQQQLTEVDEALAAIEDGSYGICSNCGKAIPPERLHAKPWALLCIDCQEALEAAQPPSAGSRS